MNTILTKNHEKSNKNSEKPLELTVKSGFYLSDVLTSFDQLPSHTDLIAYTGIGKSTATMDILAEEGKGIYLCSSVLSLQQLSAKYPKFGAFYQDEKRIAPVTICTYDSAPSLVAKLIKDGVDLSTYPLVIDEYHNFALAGYRVDALRGVNDLLGAVSFRCVVRMTGTYLPTWTQPDALFNVVKVASEKRSQAVTVVHFQRHTTNDDGTTTSAGKLADSMLVVANYFLNSGQKILIHLDNKGKGLDVLIAKLVQTGTQPESIYTLNSDNKLETLGQQLVTVETVPDNCKVLIVTSVFIESLNVKTPFDALLVEDLHTAKLEQLFNRKRGDAVANAFVFTNGNGLGHSFDLQKEYAHKLKLLAYLCEEANNEETMYGTKLSSGKLVLFGCDYSKGVKCENGKWVVDELGLSQLVYESEELYLANNPIAFKHHAKEAGYGWHFTDDVEVVVTEPMTKEEKKEVEEIDNVLSEIRNGRYTDAIAFLSSLSEVAHAEYIAKQLNGLHRRILDRAVELDYALTDLTGDTKSSWQNALKLMLHVGSDSTRGHYKLLRLFKFDKERLNNNELLDMIERAFIGQTMNRDERVELMTALYAITPELKVFVEKVQLRYWDKEPRTLLTPKAIDEILNIIFRVNKVIRKVGEKRENAFEFVGRSTVAKILDNVDLAIEFELICKRDDKKLVAPNYSEFQTALAHFAKSIEEEGDMVHSKLSIIKHNTDFAMSELFTTLHFGVDAINEHLQQMTENELMATTYDRVTCWVDAETSKENDDDGYNEWAFSLLVGGVE